MLGKELFAESHELTFLNIHLLAIIIIIFFHFLYMIYFVFGIKIQIYW